MFDWMSGVVAQGGYLGIALLMLAENVFPPIPSELIMPMAGFNAGRGTLSFVGVVAAGTLGSLAGALLWYCIGRWIGLERLRSWAAKHGRWATVAPADLDRAAAAFERHSGKTVLFGRLIPAIRTLISVPAGIAAMQLPRFLAFSALGTGVWTTILAAAGYLLEDSYRKVGDYLNPVANVILAVLVLGYLYRVVTFRRRPAH